MDSEWRPPAGDPRYPVCEGTGATPSTRTVPPGPCACTEVEDDGEPEPEGDTALDWVAELTASPCDVVRGQGYCLTCQEDAPCVRERAREWLAVQRA